MKTEWTKEITPTQPEQFQQLSPDTWIQRRNITREPDRQDGTKGGFICESRKISRDIYETIMEEKDSLTMQAITEGQAASDETVAAMMLNQMDIITAQAEQDETLAEILLNLL